jgi:hypothetical protein
MIEFRTQTKRARLHDPRAERFAMLTPEEVAADLRARFGGA